MDSEEGTKNRLVDHLYMRDRVTSELSWTNLFDHSEEAT